jgi:E3 ubiquitin-protein ligase UBR7
MLTPRDLKFSPTREGVPSSDDNYLASDLVAAQDALEAEARDVLGETGVCCTHDLGYIKQPVR